MSAFDLGLVRVFTAIYETSSVSGAASRLHMTQPSVSHALGRLRDQLHDPLFTRTRGGMVPTPLAAELYPTLQRALSDMETAIDAVVDFDPHRSRRRFRVAMSDIGAMMYLPPIVAALSRQAPNMSIDVVTINSNTVRDLLFRDKIDAVVGPENLLLAEAEHVALFTEHYQCIFRKDHPRLSVPVTLEQFLTQSRIAITGYTGPDLESYWRENNVHAHVVLRMPNLAVLEPIIAGSDHMSIVPSRIARVFAGRGHIAVSELPIAAFTYEVRLHWRQRKIETAEDRWFRTLVMNALTGL